MELKLGSWAVWAALFLLLATLLKAFGLYDFMALPLWYVAMLVVGFALSLFVPSPIEVYESDAIGWMLWCLLIAGAMWIMKKLLSVDLYGLWYWPAAVVVAGFFGQLMFPAPRLAD